MNISGITYLHQVLIVGVHPGPDARFHGGPLAREHVNVVSRQADCALIAPDSAERAQGRLLVDGVAGEAR